MGHPHHHGHAPEPSEPGRSAAAFRWSIVLNSGLTTLQLVIGFGFGSLALIGDALHNLGDVVGLVLGWGPISSAAVPPGAGSPTATGAAPRWPPS